MKQFLLAVIVIAFSVSAYGETHVTDAFSLTIAPGMYKQDPNLFPDMNKPGAGMVFIGNKAFDTFKKGGDVEPSQPLCWAIVRISKDVVKFENTPECFKLFDEGTRKAFVGARVNNYQSSFINKYNRNCFNVNCVTYDGDIPINAIALSIPTVNGLVTVNTNSTEKAAGTAFNNLVLLSMTMSAPEPKSIPKPPKSIMPNSAIDFSAKMGQLVGILIPVIIVLMIISKIRNRA